MIPAATNASSKEKRPVSQPDIKPVATNTASPEKKGAIAWLRSLFDKLSELVRTAARKIADLAKRSPLTIAAEAAIALLFIV